MEIDVRGSVRKMGTLLVAIVLYYVVHEGARLLYTLKLGVFRRVAFTGLGVQIVTYEEQMSDVQATVFCVLGAAATFVAGRLLILLMPRILEGRHLFLRAAAFYTTIIFLLDDFVYLSMLYPYVGRGGINGIKLIISEGTTRILTGVILAVHLVVVARYVYPVYRGRLVSG